MATPALQKKPASGDEAEIRALIAAWTKALETKNVDGLAANLAPDILLFDLKPPFRIKGVEAYRKMWEACLPYFPAKMKAERRDLQVVVDGDVAFAHCLNRISAVGEPSRAGETWIRVTVCYRKIKGRWLSVHEHVSVPYDPMSGKVVHITDSDLAKA